MINFSLVVAIDAENGIGKNNTLPWYLPEDLKHFKQVTCQSNQDDLPNAVIMGRKTWESLPDSFKPLPQRLNIVVTRNSDYALPDNVLRSAGLSDALNQVEILQKNQKCAQAFVIGGGQIFNEAISLNQCQSLYITHIEKNFDCDVFFPEFQQHFDLKDQSEIFESESISYHFSTYIRKY